ncbi:GyrI-like domain-containing protein [Microbacterium esteraromaticum]|uniref:GyrI-like domain-containing protein n=1 Tax=Microbacterium esteraromaticum TaxID=57043 RepID=UPI0032420332
MTKVDFKKKLDRYRSAPGEFRVLEVPATRYLMIDGEGDPKKAPPARLDEDRLETLTEGLCVHTLHVGAFDDEGPLLARMHDEFVPGAGLRMTGRHHEIYLSDPRRTAPERLRTLLRQPVRAASDTA